MMAQPVAAPVEFDGGGALAAEPSLPPAVATASLAPVPTVALSIQLTQAAPPTSQPASEPVEPLLTLEEAVAIAVRDNRGVRTAALDVDRAGDRIGAARTRRYPAIHAGFEADYPLLPIDLTFQKGDFGTFASTGPIPSRRQRSRPSDGWRPRPRGSEEP